MSPKIPEDLYSFRRLDEGVVGLEDMATRQQLA